MQDLSISNKTSFSDAKDAKDITSHDVPDEICRKSISIWKLALIFIIFAAAFGVRVYRISESPLEFAPTRQYHSALLARYYFL